MAGVFERWFTAGWGQMDFNAHLANTAYLDLAADTRMMYFAEHGFPMREFERLRLGPVVRRDEIEYHREVRLLERVRVDLVLEGLSADASRFRLGNTFHREDGTVAARVISAGGWLSLAERKLVAPPEALAAALRALARSESYADIVAGSR
jgi:acyl-CoA thioester hydrolase